MILYLFQLQGNPNAPMKTSNLNCFDRLKANYEFHVRLLRKFEEWPFIWFGKFSFIQSFKKKSQPFYLNHFQTRLFHSNFHPISYIHLAKTLRILLNE